MATELQKKAMRLRVKSLKNDRRPKPMGKIMREAGYSRKASYHPGRMMRSKGWQELLLKFFPDDGLLKIHNTLLRSKDSRVKMEALKEAYKLKDKYPARKFKLTAFQEREKVLEGD